MTNRVKLLAVAPLVLGAAVLAGALLLRRPRPASEGPAPTPTSGDPAIRVEVVNSAGEALSDADVTCHAWKGGRLREACRTRTDARGVAHLPSPSDADAVFVVARRPGFASHLEVWSSSRGTIRLAEDEPCRGWVRDEAGKPIPQARVESAVGLTATGASVQIEMGSASTDDTGAFVIAGLPERATVTLKARKEGHSPKTRILDWDRARPSAPTIVLGRHE